MGESATERKSTTLNKAVNHFKSVLGKDFNVCWGVGSAEGLQKVLKGKEEYDNTPVGTLLAFLNYRFISITNTTNIISRFNVLFSGNFPGFSIFS